jgi:hypothetical protein
MDKQQTETLRLQRIWLDKLQQLDPKRPILVQTREKSHWIVEDGTAPIITRTIRRREIVFDFDSKDWNSIKREARKLTDYLSKEGIPYLLAWSGGKGLHVHIFLDASAVQYSERYQTADKEDKLDILRIVRETVFRDIVNNAKLQESEDLKLDRLKVSWSKRTKGSLIREFGCTREDGGQKTLIDSIPKERPKPGELPLVFPQSIEKWDIRHYDPLINAELEKAFAQSERETVEVFEYGGVDCDIPCYLNLLAGRKEGSRNPGAHDLSRLDKLLGTKKEVARENLVAYAHNCEGYDSAFEKEVQVTFEGVWKREEKIKRIGCKSLRDSYGEEVCDREKCPIWKEKQARKVEDSKDQNKGGDGNQAKQIVDLTIEKAELFFHDQHKRPFASVDFGDHREIWPIRSSWFSDWVRLLMEKSTGKIVSPDSLRCAIDHLESLGRRGAKHILSVRVAWLIKDRELLIDTCNDKWQAIKVTKEGWELVEKPPIVFHRPQGAAPLPIPIKNGSIDGLMSILNQRGIPSGQAILLKVMMAFNLIPRVAKPIFVIGGDQGSGKSKWFKAEKGIIDPSDWEEHKPPKNEDQLTRDFAGNLIVYYGNITKLSDDQQDWFCIGATGGGFNKRKLYTDDEEIVKRFLVSIRLNGINVAGSNPDFLDRVILVVLRNIPPDKMLSDDEWEDRLEIESPNALGAFLDALSKAIGIFASINLKERYRLGAFCKWGEAIAQGMGSKSGEFMKAYKANRLKVSKASIELNPIGQAIVEMISGKGSFIGTASDLLATLNAEDPFGKGFTRDKDWPKAANKLSEKFNTIKVDLERYGLKIEELPREKAEKKYPSEKYKIEHRSRKTNIIVINEPDTLNEVTLWNDSELSEEES